ncbi:MAG TPA: hypothetical protein VIK82_04500 [Porticoccaceae bacterium]
MVTVLWGGVVAGHAHFGIDHEHCHVCLLPQVADVAPAALESHLPPHLATALETPVYDYRTPTAAPYHSRAPPT